jgi:small subunit ribosomal protein S27Ae
MPTKKEKEKERLKEEPKKEAPKKEELKKVPEEVAPAEEKVEAKPEKKEKPKVERKKKVDRKIFTLYRVEGEKVTRLRPSCERCGPGFFMADHGNRFTCGHCGFTRYKPAQG